MLLMRRVSSIVLVILTYPVLAGCWQGDGNSAGADQPKLLDLTQFPAADRRSMGVPGASVGGYGGQPIGPKPYELPLEIRIERITRVSGQGLTVDLGITNRGAGVFRLPSCVDQTKAHHAGMSGRRTFQFRLMFRGPNHEPLVSTVVDVTFGADSSSECLVDVAPGDTISVRFSAPLPANVQQAAATPGAEIQITAMVSELRLSDKAFVVQTGSTTIKSRNALQIPQGQPSP